MAAGLPLNAHIEGLGPQCWALSHQSRRLVVSLDNALDAAAVTGWGLDAHTSVVCRADALDDELAFNLARRHPLTLL